MKRRKSRVKCRVARVPGPECPLLGGIVGDALGRFVQPVALEHPLGTHSDVLGEQAPSRANAGAAGSGQLVDPRDLAVLRRPGANPYRFLPWATRSAPDGSVLYLQPGQQAFGSLTGPLLIDRPLVLAGPGVALGRPNALNLGPTTAGVGGSSDKPKEPRIWRISLSGSRDDHFRLTTTG